MIIPLGRRLAAGICTNGHFPAASINTKPQSFIISEGQVPAAFNILVISGFKRFCLWEPYNCWKINITIINSMKKELKLCVEMEFDYCLFSGVRGAPQRVGAESALSWASTWRCSTGAHWGWCWRHLSCTERPDTGMDSGLQFKTQSSRNTPWK